MFSENRYCRFGSGYNYRYMYKGIFKFFLIGVSQYPTTYYQGVQLLAG